VVDKRFVCLFFLLLLPSALACGSSGSSLSVQYVPFQEVNESVNLFAYYHDENNSLIETNASVQLLFNGSVVNYSVVNNYYVVGITDNVSEDVSFQVQANSTDFQCQNESFVIGFRVPFEITFNLFRDSNGSVSPYKDEFSYVYLLSRDSAHSYQLGDTNFMKYLNPIGRLFPYWTDIEYSSWRDDNVYFWGRYDDGSATITLYEVGNYSGYLLSERYYGVSVFPEFWKPVNDPSGVSIDNHVVNMEFVNVSDRSVNVYFNLWDVAKTTVIKNWLMYIVWGILWLALVVLVASVNKAASVAVAGVTLPFLLRMVGVL